MCIIKKLFDKLYEERGSESWSEGEKNNVEGGAYKMEQIVIRIDAKYNHISESLEIMSTLCFQGLRGSKVIIIIVVVVNIVGKQSYVQ